MNGANQDRGQNEKLGVICSVFRTIMDLLCTDLPVQSLLLELVMFAHPQQLVGTCPGSDCLSLQHCIPISAFSLKCFSLRAVPCQASLSHLFFCSSHHLIMFFFFIQKSEIRKIGLLLLKYTFQAPFQPKTTNYLDDNSSGHRSPELLYSVFIGTNSDGASKSQSHNFCTFSQCVGYISKIPQ